MFSEPPELASVSVSMCSWGLLEQVLAKSYGLEGLARRVETIHHDSETG